MIGDRLKNLADVARAVRLAPRLAERERWPREQIEAYQANAFAEIVSWASRHSPFYRRRYGGPIDAADVRRDLVPPVTKAETMAAFDEVVTDPGVRRAEVERHLEGLGARDVLFRGTHRVMASSGSSGQRGLYLWDRPAWSTLLAGGMRWMTWMGVTPQLPRRRIAQVAAPDVKHMTARGSRSVDVGLHRSIRIPANRSLADQVQQLARHRPDVLTGYPSALALLALEQSEGRLRIAPRAISTTSELCTADMRARIVAAWGCEPIDCYAMTETGIAAVSCAEERQRHLFEDLCLVEVVDADGRSVPSGTTGARVLVTNFANRVQPFIRFEVSDLLTVDDEPCGCGRTLRRLVAVEGRSDDVLSLPTITGGRVAVHPIHLRSPVAAQRGVLEYQILYDDAVVEVLVVVPDAAAEVTEALRRTLDATLRGLGVATTVEVRRVPHIEREAGAGKLKLVKPRPARAA